MTSTQLSDLNRVVQKLQETFKLECVLTMAHDSCGDGAVLVTTDASTCEVRHDLIAADAGCVWEICPGNGEHDYRPLTAAGIAKTHFRIFKEEAA